jgi:hypothetical protein
MWHDVPVELAASDGASLGTVKVRDVKDSDEKAASEYD